MVLGPGRTIVGRESGDILLHDVETSALHAEIEFTQGHVIVRDLGSRNGTWREGKRLPQFALYRGQTFRCGTTDITLVDVVGADAPVAGGTASGRDDGASPAPSSSTMPSAAVPTASASQTLSRGVMPPASSSPTAPGPPNTLIGHAPPPPGPDVATPPPSAPTATTPGTGFEPAAAASVAPGPVGPHAPAAPPMAAPPMAAPPMAAPPMAAPGAPSFGAGLGAPPGAPPPGVPMPVVAASSAPLAPVANAVIKLGDARPRGTRPRATVDPRARRRLLTRVVLGIVGAGLLGGLIFGIYSLVAGRNQAFLQQLAREMPQDTVGVLALSSPRDALALFGDEVPAAIREEIGKDLGVDPFDPGLLEAWGLDADEPLGVSLLNGEGMVAISIGVKDDATMRSALSSKASELLGTDEDLRWIERSFGDTPGLWLDEPMSVAALLPRKRVIFVLGGPADDVAHHAKRIAETTKGESLADRPGFGEIQREQGKPVLALYVDGGSGRAALPGDDRSTMGARMALADVEGLALMLAEDGPRMHLSLQTILREGIDAVTVFEDVRRKGKLVDRLPAPVLAELDGVFSAEQLESSLTAMGPFRLALGIDFEEAFRDATSLDPRADVLRNLDGQYGYALQRLPGDDEDEDPGAMLAWAGLRDEESAKRTAERFFSKMQGDLDIQLQQVEGTTIYTIDGRRPLSYFIHDGVLWGTVGKVDLASIIKGDGDRFRKNARVPALRNATDPGGVIAGFVDLHEILAIVRQRLEDDDVEDFDRWSPVHGPLEALTLRGELHGRTFVTRLTLHTSGEQALAGLVQGSMEVAGAELAEKLGRKRRRERCEELIDHIIELMKSELKSSVFEDGMLEQRYELMDECRGDQTTEVEIDCMLRAKSLAELTACEDGVSHGENDSTPVGILEQPEPTYVPYVEDIWPNTLPTGTATGRPDPEVNYAVPLGSEPAVRGPEDALVTIVMFGDFQCPYCKRVLPTLDVLLAGEPEVRLVFRHNPLPMHADAELAARASVAAHLQGKFWPMHDKLFGDQAGLTENNYRVWASELGLDLVRFDRDLHDAAIMATVEADMADAQKFGASFTPSFFINGRYISGAQPLASFQAVVGEEKERAQRFVERRGNTRKRLYEDMIGHFADQVVAAPTAPVAVAVTETRHTIETSGLPRRGTAGYARVEIVECGDFDCPFCARAETTMDTILRDYEGKVALFWLHNPLSFHVGAEPAARAAVAAHAQGKFWEMHDKLFAAREKRSDLDFVGYASDLGLDTTRFESDLHDTATATTVTDQQRICTDNEARGTPTFFINGRLLSGAQSYDQFKEVIEQELSSGI